MPKASSDALTALSLSARLPDLEKILSHPERRIKTGFHILDSALVEDDPGALTGLLAGSITVLGAQPKIGKSLWAQHILEYVVENKSWAYCCDFENGEQRFMRRLLTRRSQVTRQDLRNGLDRDQRIRWEEAKTWIHEIGEQFLFDHNRQLTPIEFPKKVAKIAQLAGNKDLVVVVDSLQKLPVNLSRDRRGGIDAWLRAIEEARDETGATFLLVSELRRPAITNKSSIKTYVPDGISFKESGDIEYTADLALTFTKVGQRTALLECVYARDDGNIGPIARYELQRPYYQFVESPIVV